MNEAEQFLNFCIDMSELRKLPLIEIQNLEDNIFNYFKKVKSIRVFNEELQKENE